MVGMGLDTGNLVYSRSTGQAAVDAAALSAVSALPSADPNQVVARAAAFNAQNDYVDSPNNQITTSNVSYVQYDYDSHAVTYGVPFGSANGVRVALEGGNAISTPAFLTPLFRLFGASASSTNNVNVSAVTTIAAKPSIPLRFGRTCVR